MQHKGPIVTIVTPVFNRANIIHKSIDSVIAQTYKNWELMIIDDGSTDNISEVIGNRYSGDSRIHFIRREKTPKGASTCRNIGAENAKGDYLIFLDSDDLLEPFCLEQRIAVMATDPDLDFAVFPLKVFVRRKNYVCKNFDNGKDPLINFLSKKSYWAIMCPIWKRQFFSVIGGFNDKFPRYQDIEIHIRALTQTGVQYKLCSNHLPDTEVIPSVKSDTVNFAMNLYSSLQLLIPQTSSCLKETQKLNLMKHMEGYLREWLRHLAFANFDNALLKKTDEIFMLFRKHNVISGFKIKYYKIQIKVINFFIRLIKYLYIKSIN